MNRTSTIGLAVLAAALTTMTPGEAAAQAAIGDEAARARIEELERKVRRLEELLERQASGGAAQAAPVAPAAAQGDGPPAQPQDPTAAAPASAQVTAPPPGAAASGAAADDEVQRRIDELDQQLRVVGRRQELVQEELASRASQAPVVVAGREGFGIRSADSAFRLFFGGLLQVDTRAYLSNDFPGAAPDNVLIRRVRPVIEGVLNDKYSFLIRPDFAGGTFTLFDAYVEANLAPQFRIRAGKFKAPVGLERLQSPADLPFAELGFPTSLVPNRDIGLQVFGSVYEGRLAYAAGWFNGVRDGSSADTDNNSSKDFAARLFAQPFLQSDTDALRGLGFGIAVTSGTQGGTAGSGSGTTTSGNLPAYVTPGQQTFFGYVNTAGSAAFASGSRQRWMPQFHYYNGRLGVLGEYAISTQEVSRGTNHRSITTSAWQLYTTWVLTGEDASYRGVRPRHDFDPAAGTWGAFEVGLRVQRLEIDDDAFVGSAGTRLADPSVSARRADDIGLSLNWYLNRNVKFQTTYDRTRFRGGAAKGGDLPDEQVLFTRLQMAF